MSTSQDVFVILEKLNQIGWMLSSEKNISKLLEHILHTIIDLSCCDGGTLYLIKDNKCHFEVLYNKSLNIALGGTTGKPITFPPVALYLDDNQPNKTAVAAYAAVNGQTVNIQDVYNVEGFDFTTTRLFDKRTGYRTKSILTVPLKIHDGRVIGVIQLLNATNPKTNEIITFTKKNEHLVESLASQAALVLYNKNLGDQLESLFEAFIDMINNAIDEKSPYTANHCKRVPVLTMMIAQATEDVNYGPLKDFKMTEKDRYELKIAGLLHDCGKITTPIYVMDKKTKLETIFDRIHLVETRFEILKRDYEILHLKGQLDTQEYKLKLQKIEEYKSFIQKTNIGGEFLTDAQLEMIKEISRLKWINAQGIEEPFLSADEIENISIRRGTLNKKERDIINHHINVTIDMLTALPWPEHLKNVPEYAGGHHEKMDGTGYPKKLKREQMSLQARMMGIADIFEALTAKDRPYKPAKKISESLHILGKMKLDNHVDPDIFDIFIREKVYLKYAKAFLQPEQIDEVDESKIPGYFP